jgi:hypothetical protein
MYHGIAAVLLHSLQTTCRLHADYMQTACRMACRSVYRLHVHTDCLLQVFIYCINMLIHTARLGYYGLVKIIFCLNFTLLRIINYANVLREFPMTNVTTRVSVNN